MNIRLLDELVVVAAIINHDFQASSLLKQQVCGFACLYSGASDQFMNKHLLVKMRQLCVANLDNSFAITCDWRLESVHFPCAAE